MFLKDFKNYLFILTTFGCVTLYFSPFAKMTYLRYKLNITNNMSHEQYHEVCGVGCVDRELDNMNSPKYLVHTRTCVIPNFPIDHPSIAKFKPKEPAKVVCGNKDPLTESFGLMLKFYPDRIWQYGLPSRSSLNCSYQGIVRVTQDPKNANGNCDRGSRVNELTFPMTEDETPIKEDAILVTCYNNTAEKQVIYKNVHYFVQPSRFNQKRKRYQKKVESEKRGTPENLNVLIYGNDAVSRNNLIRQLPKTYDYLMNKLGAIDLQGFNKIGDNTFPNMITVLTGLSMGEIKNHSCMANKLHNLDNCPFMWKNFSQKDYVTFYLEDAPWMGAFRYAQTGFILEPTDFYNSPYAYVSDHTIGHSAGYGSNGNMCQGGKLSASVLLDYTMKFAETLQDVPYFGYVWQSALTHDSLHLASAADQPSLEYLQNMYEGGYLENTILFFISDHGIRYGSIRSTYAGMLEERLPYVLIVFPQWFKNKYPEAVKNLQTNTRRLTSNYDLYATLLDICSHAYADLTKSFVGPRYGQSLFQEVSVNRTCEDLNIDAHLCTCQNTTEAKKDDPHLLGSANYTISVLNKQLQQFEECVQLELDKVISGRVGVPYDSIKISNSESIVKKYVVIFSTKPSGAELESSVQYDSGKYELLSEVSRINTYGKQSHCINDFKYRKYCYCKDLLH